MKTEVTRKLQQVAAAPQSANTSLSAILSGASHRGNTSSSNCEQNMNHVLLPLMP
jgi:hypothetical protein